MLLRALVVGERSWQTRFDVLLETRVGDFCLHLSLVGSKPSRVQG